MNACWPNGTLTRPAISSGFGWYTINGVRTRHWGTDFYGFSINRSIYGGIVEHADWTDIGDGGGGIEVRILQDNGDKVRYLHNRSTLVSKGDRVEAGTPLGIQGGSGYRQQNYWDTHVHVEVWIDGSNTNANKVDPVPYIQNLITSTSGGGITPIEPIEEEEDEMKNSYIAWFVGSKQMNAIVNTGSGYFGTFESNNGTYNTAVLRAFGIDSPSVTLSQGHAELIEKQCAQVRAGLAQ